MDELDREHGPFFVTRTVHGSRERVSGPYKSRNRARRARDRKDLDYGSAVHGICDASGKAW